MKSVRIDRPEKLAEWGLEGVELKVDDGLSGREREILVRSGTAIAIKAARLAAKGEDLYEDPASIELLVDQFDRARRAVREVVTSDGPLPPDQAAEFLDSLGIVERDAISNEVVGANRLGSKNGSGSLSS